MSTIRFRKKPVVIEAVQWLGDNEEELYAFTGYQNFVVTDHDDRANSDDPEATASVFDVLHSTWVLVYTGQWVIKGVKGEFYPINEQVLAETYDRVNPLVEAARETAEDRAARLDEIRARLDAATPGPWTAEEYDDEPGEAGCGILVGKGMRQYAIAASIAYPWHGQEQTERDAALIANAPTDIAWLLPELEAACRERDAYKKAKQENDERFQLAAAKAGLERDAALSELEAAQARLGKAREDVARIHWPRRDGREMADSFEPVGPLWCDNCADVESGLGAWPCRTAEALGLGEEGTDDA